ncbi:MAG: nitronate monooxygenase [Candidatus Lokiarchaeota archaeon]|nr:nitronate monooxygenase [Candidatus Lokiarchaeota archaeon]
MKWQTKITEMTNIEYPIIMGAFAIIGKAEFTAAFSNAGGLGILTAINFKTIEEFTEEIKKVKELTNKPWGINFTISPPISNKQGKNLGRDEDSYLQFLNIAIDEGVKIFTTSAYNAKKIGERIQDAECYWFHKCSTIKHAKSAEKAGVDAITLVGLEGTGFKNPYQNTTLVNLTMAKKLLNIPIIAAGGIGDARGFLGALFMGAEAVCFGTAIIPTKESLASDYWKKKIIRQNIFDDKFHKKVFHYALKESLDASMAAGHCEKIISIEDFIKNSIIEQSEEIIKNCSFL